MGHITSSEEATYKMCIIFSLYQTIILCYALTAYQTVTYENIHACSNLAWTQWHSVIFFFSSPPASTQKVYVER